MHKFIVAALLLGTAGFAHAADAVVEEVVVADMPVGFNWTGGYVGVHLGYGTGRDDVRTTILDPTGNPFLPTASNSFDADGVLGGLQAGYNWQMDQFVFGVEGEYSRMDVKGDFNFDKARPEAVAGGKLTDLAAIKARIGMAFDRTLIFGTTGYAVGWSEGYANNVWALAPADDVARGKDTVDGFVVGVGAEHAVTDTISIKGEYDYYSLGRGDFNMKSAAYPAGVVLQTEPKFNLHTFKIGVNYHF